MTIRDLRAAGERTPKARMGAVSKTSAQQRSDRSNFRTRVHGCFPLPRRASRAFPWGSLGIMPQPLRRARNIPLQGRDGWRILITGRLIGTRSCSKARASGP